MAAKMLVISCTALALLSAQGQPPVPSAGAPASPSAIGGMVFAGTGRQPVAGARVVISSLSDPAVALSGASDAFGAFRIEDIPDGRYAIRATKPGWLDGGYGSLVTGYLGLPMTLKRGEVVSDVVLRLVPGAVIGGAVVGPSGAPMSGVEVRVFRYLGELGIETLAPIGETASRVTDDQGEYRIYGLPAGEFVVAALPPAPLSQRAGMSPRLASTAQATPLVARAGEQNEPTARVEYAPVFHPSVSDAGAAAKIMLKAGEQRLAINVQMHLVPVVTVRGRAQGRQSMTNVQVTLSTAGEASLMSSRTVTAGRQGEFEFAGVPPGSYSVFARALSPAVQPGTQLTSKEWADALYARADVRISSRDEVIDLDLVRGGTVAGTVSLRGRVEPATSLLNSASVRLVPENAGVFAPPVIPDEQGTFRFLGVPPGRYRVVASPPRSNEDAWFFETALLNGIDVSERYFDVATDAAMDDLRVTFTRERAELSGRLEVTGTQRPDDYQLVVFPADRSMWKRATGRFSQRKPTASGDYLFSGLPGGDYYLAVVTSSSEAIMFAPTVLDQLATMAVRIQLQVGKRVTQDVRVVGGRPEWLDLAPIRGQVVSGARRK